MGQSLEVVVVGGAATVPLPPLDGVARLARVTVVDGAAESWPPLREAEVGFLWDFRFDDAARLFAAAPKLRWLHVAAVGVDRVLTPEVVAGDVLVTNSRGVFDRAIAEYVLGLLLAHVKGLRDTYELQQQRVWLHRTSRSLSGRRVAVVGTGSIGRSIARLLTAVGVQVELVGTRRRVDPDLGPVHSSEDLRRVAAECDALVLAAPATDRTRGMAGRQVLAALGPDGYLVNIGRGSLVVESDLVDALASGALGGAALDVFEVEPLPPDSPLWGMPNVVVSPHMSADADGFAEDLLAVFTGNLRRWIDGDPLDNVVDKKLGYVPSGGRASPSAGEAAAARRQDGRATVTSSWSTVDDPRKMPPPAGEDSP